MAQTGLLGGRTTAAVFIANPVKKPVGSIAKEVTMQSVNEALQWTEDVQTVSISALAKSRFLMAMTLPMAMHSDSLESEGRIRD